MPCPLCHTEANHQIGIKDGYTIVQCDNCDFYYIDPIPSDEQISAYYENYHRTDQYKKNLRKKTFTAGLKIRSTLKHNRTANKTFLDVGCNLGAVTEAARRLGFQATGIDLDDSTIQEAKKLFPECEFITASSFDLVAQGKTYDTVFCMEVIEHVPDPHVFAQSLSDLLNPGGILYITTPDAGHWRRPKDFLSWKGTIPPEHIGLFDKVNLESTLVQHGLEPVHFKWSHRACIQTIFRKTG